MEERRKTPLQERQEFLARYVSLLKEKHAIHPHQIVAMKLKLESFRVAVSEYTLRKWMAGAAMPEITQMKGIAAMLGVTPEYLAFGRCDQDEAEVVRIYRSLPAHSKIAVSGMLRKLEATTTEIA